MADGSTGSGASQRSAAGVAEEVQHLHRAVRGADLLLVPRPVDRLLREHAGVLEAGGADDEGQLILPSPQLIFHFSGRRRRYSHSPPP
mgnify:CR=1 FL=1